MSAQEEGDDADDEDLLSDYEMLVEYAAQEKFRSIKGLASPLNNEGVFVPRHLNSKTKKAITRPS